MMKGSDYIVQFLIDSGVRHVFGYPGGMITHLMDSLGKRSDEIISHVMRNEQGVAFAACGYAQATNSLGVAYATSGPGATNMITGICNAWYDSIPVLFITGQVNSNELKGNLGIRQRGFQENDIVSMVGHVTKYAAQVSSVEDLPSQLLKAQKIALSNRKGPVLLDICMDVTRSQVHIEDATAIEDISVCDDSLGCEMRACEKVMKEKIGHSTRPIILLGNGARSVDSGLLKKLGSLGIPTVTSLPAFELGRYDGINLGFIGAYGRREANFAIAKSDLIIAIGSRLDIRQVGARRNAFAPNATIVRIDIDDSEFNYPVHSDDLCLKMEADTAIRALVELLDDGRFDFSAWVDVCIDLKRRLQRIDDRLPNRIIRKLGSLIPDDWLITADVGQNQVWIAQSLPVKGEQSVFFSAGYGAMGYSLPASVGVYYGANRPVVSFTGDGGLQMTMQELQVISQERLPINIVLLNNQALGMMRHFQEMYFNGRYVYTVPEGGFSSPNFEKISTAYDIPYCSIESIDQITSEVLTANGPKLIEVKLSGETYVFPKLEFGKPNQDQEPLLDRDFYAELMDL